MMPLTRTHHVVSCCRSTEYQAGSLFSSSTFVSSPSATYSRLPPRRHRRARDNCTNTRYMTELKPCYQNHPPHSSRSAFSLSSGRVWTLISQRQQFFMQRDILPWIAPTMTRAISTLLLSSVKAKPIPPCISSMVHKTINVRVAWI